MARIVILGGGFGGVTAAQALAGRLGPEHQITLVARQREFTFFPALVRLAFGACELHEVFYEEISDEAEREHILSELFKRAPHLTPVESRLTAGLAQSIVFRLRITSLSGVFEKW